MDAFSEEKQTQEKNALWLQPQSIKTGLENLHCPVDLFDESELPLHAERLCRPDQKLCRMPISRPLDELFGSVTDRFSAAAAPPLFLRRA